MLSAQGLREALEEEALPFTVTGIDCDGLGFLILASERSSNCALDIRDQMFRLRSAVEQIICPDFVGRAEFLFRHV